MKFLLLGLLFFFSGCGVATDSSSVPENITDAIVGPDGEVIVDGGSTGDEPDDNTSGTDDNTSGTDDNTSGTDDNSTTDVETSGLYDEAEADFDPQSCTTLNSYNFLVDSSLDSDSKADLINGLEINSFLDQTSISADFDKTEVRAFYPDFTSVKKNSYTTIYEPDEYYLSFDEGWLLNSDNHVYIQLPNDVNSSLLDCYSYTLDTVTKSELVRKKVYR